MTEVLQSKSNIILGLLVVVFSLYCIASACRSFSSFEEVIVSKNTVQNSKNSLIQTHKGTFKDYQNIENRNLLRVENVPSALLVRAINNANVHKDLSMSKRGFHLLGTVCGEGVSTNRAVISYNNKELLYGVGESVNGWKIIEIQRREIVLQRGMLKERLVLDEIAQTQALKDGDVRLVSKGQIQKQLRNLGALAQHIELVPQTINGSKGLYVASLQAGSFMHAMGLREGDMLAAVNGVPVTSFSDVVSLAPVLEQTRISLKVVRDGRSQTLKFRLK